MDLKFQVGRLVHLCFQVSFFGLDFSCAFLSDPLPYVCRAVAKLDALRLASAKEPHRLHVHQRYFGDLQHKRAATGPDPGPEFGEIFSMEPADQLNAGAVFVWDCFDLECHAEPGEQRVRQSKQSKRRGLARTDPRRVFGICRNIGTRWRVRNGVLCTRRSSPRGPNRDELVK
jgi:hypothetical protein